MIKDYTKLDDFDLISLTVNKGDNNAYSVLVKKYQRRMYMVALGVVRNENDAIEMVQETFLKAYKALGGFKYNAGFYSWLYRILMNLCIDHIRKNNKAELREFDEKFAQDSKNSLAEALGCFKDDPFERASRAELSKMLNEALNTLTVKHRTIIVLREVEGMSYQEIAEILEIGIGTVMSRLFHARKTLQEILVKRNVTKDF